MILILICVNFFLSFQATHSQPISGYIVILTRRRILYIHLWHSKIHWNVGVIFFSSRDVILTCQRINYVHFWYPSIHKNVFVFATDCNLHCVLRVLWPWPYEVICVVSVCFNNHITDTQAYHSKMTKFGHISELMFVFTTRRRVSYTGLKTQSLFWRSWIPARVTTVGTVVCLFVCLVFI